MYEYDKADYILRKLFVIRPTADLLSLTPEDIMKKATLKEINFYYDKLKACEDNTIRYLQHNAIALEEEKAGRELTEKEKKAIKSRIVINFYAKRYN